MLTLGVMMQANAPKSRKPDPTAPTVVLCSVTLHRFLSRAPALIDVFMTHVRLAMFIFRPAHIHILPITVSCLLCRTIALSDPGEYNNEDENDDEEGEHESPRVLGNTTN
ncbi:hypothetical protein N7527_007261 [Penicillium freii]|nr:hypothetical protein N7527_007261 [Penicillium freii]